MEIAGAGNGDLGDFASNTRRRETDYGGWCRFITLSHGPKYYVCGATVKNLRIFATLLNGDQLELSDCPTGADLIRAILHDAAAGAKALVIEATDKDGRVVRIVVPADDSETARVAIALDA